MRCRICVYVHVEYMCMWDNERNTENCTVTTNNYFRQQRMAWQQESDYIRLCHHKIRLAVLLIGFAIIYRAAVKTIPGRISFRINILAKRDREKVNDNLAIRTYESRKENHQKTNKQPWQIIIQFQKER